jgi:hypothetical protein
MLNNQNKLNTNLMGGNSQNNFLAQPTQLQNTNFISNLSNAAPLSQNYNYPQSN